MAVALAAGKPNPLELVSPVVAPAVVTATSSQFVERNYNGFAAPLVAAPVVSAAYSAPVAAAYASPYAYSAYSAYSPLAYSAYPSYVL